MEIDLPLVEIGGSHEGSAPLGDRVIEVLDRREVLVGERLVEHGPEAFGRLELGTVGRQVDEPNALGDGQPGRVCQPALSRTRMMIRSRPAPASRAKVARSFSKNGLETPLAIYQKTSPELGWTKAVT